MKNMQKKIDSNPLKSMDRVPIFSLEWTVIKISIRICQNLHTYTTNMKVESTLNHQIK